jgi:hypothetical protein
MQNTYVVTQIGPDEVDRAFLLMEPVASSLDLAAWKDFCGQLSFASRIVRDQEQVWIARNAAGTIQGLAICKLGDDLTYGRMLDVPIFVVVSAADDNGVSQSLVARLRQLAGDAGCRSIRFWTLGSDNWARRLEASSHAHWHHGVRMMMG